MQNREARVCRLATAFGLLAWSLVANAEGQSPLEVVDATDAYVGPLLSPFADNNNDASRKIFFVFDNAGEYSLLSAGNPDSIGSCLGEGSVLAFYESPACNGTPALVQLQSPEQDCQFFPIVLPDAASTNLWEVHRDQDVQVLVSGKKGLGNSGAGNCEAVSPQQQSGKGVSLWGTFDFTFPLKVRRNPFIFGDDFGSGTPEAWSNY